MIIGVPHDMPIVGYGGQTVNVLRLYSARASRRIRHRHLQRRRLHPRGAAQDQHRGDLEDALSVGRRSQSGRELRLLQEYFLVACSVRDIMRRYREHARIFDEFASKVAIQMNDTHPALTVAELMRIVHRRASAAVGARRGRSTVDTFGYTNHTLLPEALESGRSN